MSVKSKLLTAAAMLSASAATPQCTQNGRPGQAGGPDCPPEVVGGELLQDQRVHGGLLGGRPRGRFRAVIAPRVKISPPQTPCGS